MDTTIVAKFPFLVALFPVEIRATAIKTSTIWRGKDTFVIFNISKAIEHSIYKCVCFFAHKEKVSSLKGTTLREGSDLPRCRLA